MQTTDTGEFFGLTGRKTLFRVEAPDAFEQTLATQDFMATGNAAVEIVCHVEERAVAVGDTGVQGEKVRRYGPVCGLGLTALEDLHGTLRPDRPMPEESALETHGHGRAIADHREGSDQIENDVVVI